MKLSEKFYEEALEQIIFNVNEFNFIEEWYKNVMNLNNELKISYLINILESQIYSGTLAQYFSGGYGQFAKETILLLKEIGSLKKSIILSKAFNLVNYNNYSDELFREKLLKFEIEKLFTENIDSEFFDSLLKLTEEYFESEDENLDELLEVYLLNK